MHFISLNEDGNLLLYTICLEKITIYFIYARQRRQNKVETGRILIYSHGKNKVPDMKNPNFLFVH